MQSPCAAPTPCTWRLREYCILIVVKKLLKKRGILFETEEQIIFADSDVVTIIEGISCFGRKDLSIDLGAICAFQVIEFVVIVDLF